MNNYTEHDYYVKNLIVSAFSENEPDGVRLDKLKELSEVFKEREGILSVKNACNLIEDDYSMSFFLKKYHSKIAFRVYKRVEKDNIFDTHHYMEVVLESFDPYINSYIVVRNYIWYMSTNDIIDGIELFIKHLEERLSLC